MQSDRRPDLWSWVMEQVSLARGRGADLRPQTAARGSGILYGLVGRTPYDALPSWAKLMAQPWDERLRALSDPAFCEALVSEAERPVEASGPLAPKDPAKLYLLPPGPATYDVGPGNSLAAEAARRATSPAQAFLDFTLQTDGLGLLYYPVLNQDLDAVGAMLTNPEVVVGVGDAGAHVALTMDAGQPTYLLKHWVRDHGVLDMGTAIRKLTSESAELFGIGDRGVLAPGAYADVNVIDMHSLDLTAPTMLSDFPLHAKRYVQRAQGYDYTLVNGQIMVEHDELTGEHAGRVLTAR